MEDILKLFSNVPDDVKNALKKVGDIDLQVEDNMKNVDQRECKYFSEENKCMDAKKRNELETFIQTGYQSSLADSDSKLEEIRGCRQMLQRYLQRLNDHILIEEGGYEETNSNLPSTVRKRLADKIKLAKPNVEEVACARLPRGKKHSAPQATLSKKHKPDTPTKESKRELSPSKKPPALIFLKTGLNPRRELRSSTILDANSANKFVQTENRQNGELFDVGDTYEKMKELSSKRISSAIVKNLGITKKERHEEFADRFQMKLRRLIKDDEKKGLELSGLKVIDGSRRKCEQPSHAIPGNEQLNCCDILSLPESEMFDALSALQLLSNERNRNLSKSQNVGESSIVNPQESDESRSNLEASSKSQTSTSAESTEHESNESSQADADDANKRYCLCDNIAFGNMVACDGVKCPYEWFHYDCVNIKSPPAGKWYCPECKNLLKKFKTPGWKGGRRKRTRRFGRPKED